MFYFDNYLIVAQNHSIRFVQILASEITTSINQYQNDPNGGGISVMPPLLDREYSGIL